MIYSNPILKRKDIKYHFSSDRKSKVKLDNY